MIDRSSTSEHTFQASQSPFTIRHTRLTASLLTAAKDGRECPPHPTRFGPGKIGAGNQRSATADGDLRLCADHRDHTRKHCDAINSASDSNSHSDSASDSAVHPWSGRRLAEQASGLARQLGYDLGSRKFSSQGFLDKE
jgi:hypothetical protein